MTDKASLLFYDNAKQTFSEYSFSILKNILS